ncbi:MAG: hypothetical protein WBA45_07345 [Microthrixaceae bacterium]
MTKRLSHGERRSPEGPITGICPFCGQRAGGNEEHVIPKWYSRLVNKSDDALFPPMIRQTGGQVVPSGRQPSKVINLTTRAVCSDCNSGWLKTNFEDRAKPLLSSLIRGHVLPEPVKHLSDAQRPQTEIPTVPIDAEDRALLALWAYKTALLMELINDPRRENPLEIKESEFRRFRSEESVPNGFSIVLGCYSNGPLMAHAQRVAHTSRAKSEKEPARDGLVCVTILMRPLIFQVLTAGSPGGRAKRPSGLYEADTKNRLILLKPEPEFPLPITIPGLKLPGFPMPHAEGFAASSLWPPQPIFGPAEYAALAAGPLDNNISRSEGKWAGLHHGHED